MNEEEVLDIQAGKELDDLVAKNVMNWHTKKISTVRGAITFYLDNEDYVNRPVYNWNPSEDISDAWEVVDELSEHGWYLEIKTNFPVDVTVSIRDSRSGTWDTQGLYDKWITKDCGGKTVPLAICRAALLTVIDKLL